MKKKTKKHVSIEIIEKVMNYNLSFCITFAIDINIKQLCFIKKTIVGIFLKGKN